MLTNFHCSFQKLCAFETDLSDFRNMTVTAKKILYKKESQLVSYQNYRNYSNDIFWQLVSEEFANYRYVIN